MLEEIGSQRERWEEDVKTQGDFQAKERALRRNQPNARRKSRYSVTRFSLTVPRTTPLPGSQEEDASGF